MRRREPAVIQLLNSFAVSWNVYLDRFGLVVRKSSALVGDAEEISRLQFSESVMYRNTFSGVVLRLRVGLSLRS